MNQRDRVAWVIHDVFSVGVFHDKPDMFDYLNADLMIEKGVRVVDVDTLVSAIHKTTGYPVGEKNSVIQKWATEVLDAL